MVFNLGKTCERRDGATCQWPQGLQQAGRDVGPVEPAGARVLPPASPAATAFFS